MDHRSQPADCYVYGIFVDGVLRYIGKGRGSRVFQHLKVVKASVDRVVRGKKPVARFSKHRHFYSRLAAALQDGAAIEERLITIGLSDEEAYAEEMQAISAQSPGVLWNVLDGGIGTTSAAQKAMWTEERKRRRSALMKGKWADPDFAQRVRAAKVRPEVVAKQRETALRNWTDPQYRQRTKIATDDPAVRLKISNRAKAQHADPVISARMYEANRQAQNRPDVKIRKSKNISATKRRRRAERLTSADPPQQQQE